MPARLMIAIFALALWTGPILANEPVGEAGRGRLRAAMAVKQRHAASLMATPDVVGIGTGIDADGQAVIRVLTTRPGVVGLPARLEGLPVRLRVTGRIHALRGTPCDASGDGVCETTERWPLPVPIGVSVGHPSVTAGTIGARVTDGTQVFALSNNHVLASSNGASLGDAALQPGPFDGGSLAAGDEIGTLHDFEPLLFCELGFPFFICSQSNQIDAALALSSPGELGFATPTGELGSAPGYGAPSPVIHAAYGDPLVLGDEDLAQLQQLAVQKHGRTTGLTLGTIDTIGLTVDVCYDELCNLAARFDDQLGAGPGFSAGGDSGSLVVTDDALHQPVALVFAGSETQSILNRIDLVLTRFGVTIDDGGTTGPISDARLASLATPPFALVGQPETVSATVRNVGSEPLPPFDVLFADTTEGTSSTLPVPALGPGAQAQLDFSWTPLQTGVHSLGATLQITDDDPSNDQATADVSVLLEPPGISLRLWTGTAHTDSWTTVDLDVDYGSEMVVVCTPLYDVTGLGPLVPRVRNASGMSFEVGLGRPWFGAFPGEETSEELQCLVAREGVYSEPGQPLVEAVRIDGFGAKDDASSWVGQAVGYAHSYAQPVVVGQVISPTGGGAPGEIGVWSMFWARGPTAFDPPSAAQLFVGRHTGEDPFARAPESLAYVVIEAGSGILDGVRFVAGLGAETVRGVDDAPPYAYALTPPFTTATAAVASSAGMDGIEGGWPILYGGGAVQPDELRLAIEEDWYFDPERSHTTEQVGFIAFGTWVQPGPICGLGIELVILLPLLGGLRRMSPSRRIGSSGLRPRVRSGSAPEPPPGLSR